ncbi:hypothetical protein BGW80DRAFT_1558199 [Lactifluus volemus]|nr:hypothetical protein BGW80DRAFT_1558199 [Lactifluus volemus]
MILKLVRATISALLRVALLGQWRFRRFPGNDLSPSTTIDILPKGLLLEVFDSYRQGLEQRYFYYDSELTWNGKHGWLKLAHVCRTWRSIVLSSSFRLQAKLVLSMCWDRDSNRNVSILTRLPPFPIVIYSPMLLHWQHEEPKKRKRAVAALQYSDRVCKIVLDCSDLVLDNVRRAMIGPFPALESLELSEPSSREFNIPTTLKLFGGSVPSLRHLDLRYVSRADSLFQLPSTPGLIYLRLNHCQLQAASLLTLLRGMPCLRHLEISPSYCPFLLPTMPADIFHLSRLTYLSYHGTKQYLEALVAGLAAPSLQYFRIDLRNSYSSEPVPHLSRFISNIEGSFLSVHVLIPTTGNPWIICEDSHSPDHMIRKIIVKDDRTVQDGPALLCAKLSTAEQVLFQHVYPPLHSNLKSRPSADATSPWLGFFQQLQSAKILKMHSDFLHDVAQVFVRKGGESEWPFHILPSLEEIEIELRPLDRACNDAWEEVRSIFGPFVAARQHAGCPVRISWNTVPETFPPDNAFC